MPARPGPWSWLAPPPDPAARRLVVAGVAGILLTAPLSLQRLVGSIPALGYVLTLAGAMVAMQCCRRGWRPSFTATWTATVVCLVFACATITAATGQLVGALGSSDVELLCRDDVAPAIITGGQEVLHGINPYASYNVLHAEQAIGCPTFHATPLRIGTFATRAIAPSDTELDATARQALAGQGSANILTGYSWPAGSALAGIAGARGLIVLTVLSLLIAGVATVWTLPPGRRRWLALALAAQTGALVFVGPVHPDGIVAALLIVACAGREPRVSGLSLGLACAIKQTAWFIAPALLILAFRHGRAAGMRQARWTVLIAAGVNLPFVVADPSAWLKGVLAPQVNPMFPLGGGPVALFSSLGHVALVQGIFTVVMAMTVLAGWLLAWRAHGGWARAGVVLAVLGLWDGPRSLLYYMGLFGLVVVSVCARDLLSRTESSDRDPGTDRSPSLRVAVRTSPASTTSLRRTHPKTSGVSFSAP